MHRWIAQMDADRARQAGLQRTSTDSWAGSEHDDFWPSSRRRNGGESR